MANSQSLGQVALTGKGVHLINGQMLSSFADADIMAITAPNEMWKVKASKNGNVIYGFDNMGLLGDVDLRVILGSSDDKFLNSLLQTSISDPASFNLLTGSFTLRVGDGQGNFNNVVYMCAGGVFRNFVPGKESAEGDTEQAVAVYRLRFGSVNKTIV
jgi:hypothetical protein